MTLRASLEAAGLRVSLVAGWGTRGSAWAVGKPVGVMEHHTALPVPFPVERLYGDRLKCNINVKPDGTVWLIAQKACNFSSGPGSSIVLGEVRAGTPPTRNARERNLVDNINGNPWFFNFENDHPGDGSPIPQVQHDAIITATRVVLDHYELTPGNVISHAEWTARKRDPYWNGSLRAIEQIRQDLEDDMPAPKDWDAADRKVVEKIIWESMFSDPSTTGNLSARDMIRIIRSEVRKIRTIDDVANDAEFAALVARIKALPAATVQAIKEAL